MTLSELMQHNVQPITNQLALYLSRDKDAVEWGLNMLQANTVTRDTVARATGTPSSGGTNNGNNVMFSIQFTVVLMWVVSIMFRRITG